MSKQYLKHLPDCADAYTYLNFAVRTCDLVPYAVYYLIYVYPYINIFVSLQDRDESLDTFKSAISILSFLSVSEYKNTTSRTF